uniref:Uncharacterized protein n=1 Tax=Monodelphis domestica TaxID=13616 RepID=A0A5F8GEX8_MONDO
MARKLLLKEAEAKAVIEEEKQRQQAELEAFENRLKGCWKKNRKREEIEIEPSAWQKHNKVFLFIVCTIVVMFAWYLGPDMY